MHVWTLVSSLPCHFVRRPHPAHTNAHREKATKLPFVPAKSETEILSCEASTACAQLNLLQFSTTLVIAVLYIPTAGTDWLRAIFLAIANDLVVASWPLKLLFSHRQRDPLQFK